MARVVNRLLQEQGRTRAVLFGHSGGGTLGLLLAPLVKQTCAIAAIAPNLDIQAWARHHGYTPLHGSMNPADAPEATGTIPKLYWLGANDTNVPPDLVIPVAARQRNAHTRVVTDFDHSCCWDRIWPLILDLADRACEAPRADAVPPSMPDQPPPHPLFGRESRSGIEGNLDSLAKTLR
jgi:pimeloyl-ACP methyl ester carboxylesterase